MNEKEGRKEGLKGFKAGSVVFFKALLSTAFLIRPTSTHFTITLVFSVPYEVSLFHILK